MTEYPYVWNITLENFIGGFAELIYEISPYAPDPSYAVTEGTLDFQVLGLNPSDTVAETYIDANDGVHWYATAISNHESPLPGATDVDPYSQFNEP